MPGGAAAHMSQQGLMDEFSQLLLCVAKFSCEQLSGADRVGWPCSHSVSEGERQTALCC